MYAVTTYNVCYRFWLCWQDSWIPNKSIRHGLPQTATSCYISYMWIGQGNDIILCCIYTVPSELLSCRQVLHLPGSSCLSWCRVECKHLHLAEQYRVIGLQNCKLLKGSKSGTTSRPPWKTWKVSWTSIVRYPHHFRLPLWFPRSGYTIHMRIHLRTYMYITCAHTSIYKLI